MAPKHSLELVLGGLVFGGHADQEFPDPRVCTSYHLQETRVPTLYRVVSSRLALVHERVYGPQVRGKLGRRAHDQAIGKCPGFPDHVVLLEPFQERSCLCWKAGLDLFVALDIKKAKLIITPPRFLTKSTKLLMKR